MSVLPAELNLRVYLRIVDADDPTDTNGPIDDDSVHSAIRDRDNFGTGAALNQTTVIMSQIVGGHGFGTRTFTTSLNPGDNFRVVAAPRTTGLANFKPFYTHTFDETQGRLYYDADKDFITDPNEPLLDETSVHEGARLSPLLTVWRRLHVEVDSMGASVGNLPTGDPPTADVADPDTGALPAAFRPAFIDVQILESSPAGPNDGNTPFRHSFLNDADLDSYFVGPTGQRSTRNESSMYWTVYIAGIYEINADSIRDNDPDENPDGLSTVLGLTRLSEPEYSVVPMENIRDVAAEHGWSAAQTSHVQRAVVVHEIGHQFELQDDETTAYPGHIMRHPNLASHDPLTPGISLAFLESHILTIRGHGTVANPRP